MEALRARLGITQADGYVLSTDHPLPWWRRAAGGGGGGGGAAAVFLQRSGVEAAARLGLWQVLQEGMGGRRRKSASSLARSGASFARSLRASPPGDEAPWG